MNGVVNIYKERGFTSHDVVAKLRGILKQKKIGHTGTLDPEAEGVLPVCLGKATKLCELLAGHDKVYEAVLLLGRSTDTQDVTGTVTAEAEVRADEEQVRRAILSFEGVYGQIPPMYSALKVNGQKLCDLARAGKEVERKAREVRIYEICILEMELPRVRMRVHCSSGTYIRTLCHDIGEKLGCHGCMESLLRTRVERFSVEDSVRLDQVEALRDAGRLPEIILPIDRMFDGYPAVTLSKELSAQAHNGNPLPLQAGDVGGADCGCAAPESPVGTGLPGVDPAGAPETGRVRVYDHEGRFVGIYGRERDRLRLVKMFYEK
ncbi:MAG: tRNA pseudouridine(55) synthase TruB [Eubacteriales bacterium]|nr:tRNA pseudouridine(55) synthase TruB [Eubacteriales bacterium]